MVPTFAEYVPVVSAAVSAGPGRAYGSYWNRIVEHWGARRLTADVVATQKRTDCSDRNQGAFIPWRHLAGCFALVA